MFNKIKGNKNFDLFVLIVSIIVLATMLIFIVNSNSSNTYKKVNNNKSIIYTYTITNKNNKTTQIPYINISSSSVKNSNKEIKELATTYLSNSNNIFNYDANMSGTILSIVIRIIDKGGIWPTAIFRTYNINTRTSKVLTDSEILKLFNVSEKTVENKISTTFENFYTDEREKNIFDDECNYQCFLENRGITNYLDNIHYYISDGKLSVYKEFKVYSIYGEEKYFTAKDFLIKITK